MEADLFAAVDWASRAADSASGYTRCFAADVEEQLKEADRVKLRRCVPADTANFAAGESMWARSEREGATRLQIEVLSLLARPRQSLDMDSAVVIGTARASVTVAEMMDQPMRRAAVAESGCSRSDTPLPSLLLARATVGAVAPVMLVVGRLPTELGLVELLSLEV